MAGGAGVRRGRLRGWPKELMVWLVGVGRCDEGCQGDEPSAPSAERGAARAAQRQRLRAANSRLQPLPLPQQ